MKTDIETTVDPNVAAPEPADGAETLKGKEDRFQQTEYLVREFLAHIRHIVDAKPLEALEDSLYLARMLSDLIIQFADHALYASVAERIYNLLNYAECRPFFKRERRLLISLSKARSVFQDLNKSYERVSTDRAELRRTIHEN